MPDASRRVDNVGDLHRGAGEETVALSDVSRSERVTYAELEDRVASTAGILRALGVERGERVACCFDNEIRFVASVLGAARIGAVGVPVPVDAGAETLAHIFSDAASAVVLVGRSETLHLRVADAVEGSAAVETVVVDAPDPTGQFGGAQVRSLRAIQADATSVTASVDVGPTEPALQPYTSGSTGDPKGVVLTHGGIEWCTKAFCQHLSLDETECGLVVTPLFHKNAMVGVVKPMLSVGGRIVLLDTFDAERAIAAIESHDATYLSGVPAIYKRLVDAREAAARHDFSTLSWASCGSQAVPTDLVNSFADMFEATLLEVYGLTEGGPLVTHSPRDGPQKVGSAGVTLPGVTTRIVDPDTREALSAGERGELLVASPCTASYHRRPDATDAAYETRNGMSFLRTGDIAYVDEDGYHYIVGRLDDMLIVGGENVYPATVEDTLQRHAAVADVAVVGVPHAEKGQAPVAFVVTTEDVTEAELQAFARDHGRPIAYPRRVFFQPSLPLTSTGKTDVTALREVAVARTDERQ